MILNPTTSTYDNLLLAYRFMNEHLFNGILPTCLITLQRDKNTFGFFCGNRFTNAKKEKTFSDEIALNPQYFRFSGRDDKKVVSTLVHEMCHLWQHHFGKPGRSRYHNKEWADKMKSIGLIPSNTGEEGGMETGDQMTHYIESNGLFAKAFEDLCIQGFSLEWVEFPQLIQEAIVSGKVDPIEVSKPIETIDTATISGNLISKLSTKKIDTSKIKYTCPECGLNAWAKINSSLICGKCEENMISQLNNED